MPDLVRFSCSHGKYMYSIFLLLSGSMIFEQKSDLLFLRNSDEEYLLGFNGI